MGLLRLRGWLAGWLAGGNELSPLVEADVRTFLSVLGEPRRRLCR